MTQNEDKLLVDRSLIYALSDTDGCNKWWACIHARGNEDVDTEKLAQELAEAWNTRAPTAREKELETEVEKLREFVQGIANTEHFEDEIDGYFFALSTVESAKFILK